MTFKVKPRLRVRILSACLKDNIVVVGVKKVIAELGKADRPGSQKAANSRFFFMHEF